jgi:hypothetical protein
MWRVSNFSWTAEWLRPNKDYRRRASVNGMYAPGRTAEHACFILTASKQSLALIGDGRTTRRCYSRDPDIILFTVWTRSKLRHRGLRYLPSLRRNACRFSDITSHGQPSVMWRQNETLFATSQSLFGGQQPNNSRIATLSGRHRVLPRVERLLSAPILWPNFRKPIRWLPLSRRFCQSEPFHKSLSSVTGSGRPGFGREGPV